MKTQAPDIEGNSKDGLAGALPQGSSAQGMTSGSNPDGASIHTGYARVGIAGGMAEQREGDDDVFAPTQSGGGFLGRSGGWDR